jgi:hypothetical protein
VKADRGRALKRIIICIDLNSLLMVFYGVKTIVKGVIILFALSMLYSLPQHRLPASYLNDNQKQQIVES